MHNNPGELKFDAMRSGQVAELGMNAAWILVEMRDTTVKDVKRGPKFYQWIPDTQGSFSSKFRVVLEFRILIHNVQYGDFL